MGLTSRGGEEREGVGQRRGWEKREEKRREGRKGPP